MRGSLQLKVFGVIAVVAVTLVLGLATYFTRRYEDASRRELDERVRIYAALAARELEPVLEYEDEDAARGVFDALAVDEELSAVFVYRGDGSLVASWGLLANGSVVTERKPIATREAESGSVVVEMSTRITDDEIATANRMAVLVTLIALGLGLGGAWLIGRYLGHRIGGLAKEASRISGEIEPLPMAVDESTDEIARLSGSFNTMVGRLVAAQSKEIELLLTHVAKGFVIVDQHGRMGAHHSKVMDRWFAEVKKGTPIWTLFKQDPNAAAYLELAWEALFEGFLPPEVALDQFPKRLRNDGRTFELSVHPISNVGETELTSALVTLTDVTDALRREEHDAAHADLVALCERAVVDRQGVGEFMAEGEALHRAIAISETLADLRRAVHTLKGCAAQIGAESISAACHAIETGMAESDIGVPRPADVAALGSRWKLLASRLGVLIDRAPASPLTVSPADLEILIDHIESFEPHDELSRHARTLFLEPMQVRLDRAKDAARTLAAKLGKDVEVTGSAHGLRADAKVWAPFWSAFTHVVRNAVDHGLEVSDIRIATGKSPVGHLAIDVTQKKDHIVIEVVEDGAGMDWELVAKLAREKGYPADTRRDLENALFTDGFSTANGATEISGRGVGLGAIRAVVESMGGLLAVISLRGAGTTFRFTFPVTALGNAYRDTISPAVAA